MIIDREKKKLRARNLVRLFVSVIYHFKVTSLINQDYLFQIVFRFFVSHILLKC